MRSRNHPFQSGFDGWFYSGLAGINPDRKTPGFKHLIIRPQLTDILDSVSSSYNSIYGMIRSDWSNMAGYFKWSVTVPVNTSATIYLKAENSQAVTESGKPLSRAEGIRITGVDADYLVIEAGSGDYNFEIIKSLNRGGKE